MTSTTDRTAGEIDWPAWADRTPATERKRTSKYSVTQHQATKRLEAELLDRVGADDWRLSTAAAHRKSDGMPYADANPDDSGVVVRWSKNGDQYCIACDRYTDLRSNIRTIGLYVEEKRKMSNRPVHTGQDEFATARLPSGDEEEAIVASGANGVTVDDPAAVLDVSPDADEGVIEAAYKHKVKAAHPDHGGSEAELRRVRKAKEELLEG